LLPREKKKPRGGRPRVADRKVLAGIVCRLKTGFQWKGLGDWEMSRDEKPDRFRLRIASERPVLHELNQPELRLGTDPTCELHIKHDRSVAPVHATFYLRDGVWCLRS